MTRKELWRQKKILEDPNFLAKEKEYHRQYWLKHKEKYNKTKLQLRFAILQRDNFTCQYCGRSAPQVILQVDHIAPKSKGGTDLPGNLITSCEDCNLGKSDFDYLTQQRKELN